MPIVRVETLSAKDFPTVRMRDIPSGTTFKGKIGSFDGVFLRCILGVVMLAPGVSEPPCWGIASVDAVEVRFYEPVDVTLTVQRLK